MKKFFIILTTIFSSLFSSEISLHNHSENSPFKKPRFTLSEMNLSKEITPPTKDFFKTNLEAKLTSFQKLHEHGTKKIIKEFGLKELIKCELYQTITIEILNYYTNIYNQLKDNEQMSIHNVPFAYNSHIKWTPNTFQAMKLYDVAVWSIIERLQTTLHMILNHEHINIKDTRNYLCTRTILIDILDKKTN